MNLNTGVELKLTKDISMLIDTGNSQDQGARPYQEDSFGYSNIIDSALVTQRGMLAVLSDGMGGLSNGKNVADLVVQTSISMFESINPKKNIAEQLKSIVYYINGEICKQYAANAKSSSAGATMVLCYIYKNRIYWACVGDSRLYCLRNGKFFRMNEDHDYKNQLLRKCLHDGGDFFKVDEDKQKDSLVGFIGKKELQNIDVSYKGFRIMPNDTFVLCSDGIYNAISEESMKDIIDINDAQRASDAIVSNIVEAKFPGQDNMTIMVIKCGKKLNHNHI